MVTGWKMRKLGDVAEVCMCKRIFAHQTSKIGNIPFYKIGTFGKEADAFISKSLYEEFKAKYSYPEQGDVLISAAGTLGRTVVFDGHPAYFQDSNIVWLKIDRLQLCNEYLSQYYKIIKWASSEGSTISRLYNGIICDTEILLPPLDEQLAIAEVLSDVDSLISSLQKLIEKKNAIKQGAMQELLTGKKRLPGFDEEWRTYKLGELGSFDKGCGISRAESNTGNFPAVRYGELYTKHTDYVKQYYSCISGDVAQTAKRVTFGDILFAASGETKEEIGVCAAIVDRRDIFAGGDIVVFTPTTEINPIFFGTLLNMPFVQKQKSERGQGDAVVHIHADSLSEIIISMPEKNEQEAIATVIKDFNDEIEQLERKLAKYQQIKQGMMQELLTGRIRLVDADDKEQPKTQIFQEKQSQPAHNQHFDDAVMIAGIVNAFYSEKYPLGRKKVQKLLYLVRRKEQADISAFHKKAAGPYADEVRYKGGEPIAQKNRYIQIKRSDKGSCFEKGTQMQQALSYLQDWGKQADITWLVSQFQYTGVNELELLATVDMAMCDLRLTGKEISVTSIKDLIRSNKEWRDKLNKTYFSDADIRRAIKRCQELFEK